MVPELARVIKHSIWASAPHAHGELALFSLTLLHLQSLPEQSRTPGQTTFWRGCRALRRHAVTELGILQLGWSKWSKGGPASWKRSVAVLQTVVMVLRPCPQRQSQPLHGAKLNPKPTEGCTSKKRRLARSQLSLPKGFFLGSNVASQGMRQCPDGVLETASCTGPHGRPWVGAEDGLPWAKSSSEVKTLWTPGKNFKAFHCNLCHFSQKNRIWFTYLK